MDRDLLPNSKLPFKIASNLHGWISLVDANGHTVVNAQGALMVCDAQFLVRAANSFEAMLDALQAIAGYPQEHGRCTEDGYPLEVVYDEFAYRRMVDSYRKVAQDVLAKLEGK